MEPLQGFAGRSSIGGQPLPAQNNAQQGAAQEDTIMLEVLSAVERDSRLTQRSLSREVGIALGLANAYLKRCAKKGYIKVSQIPLNRYAYYLTPTGFTEKSRLTAEYLAVSFNFFRDARAQCSEIFSYCESRGLRTLALAGAGDLAEIAVLSAGENDVEIVCVIEAALDSARCAGKPIVADLEAAKALDGKGLDAVIVTDVRSPQATYEAIRAAARKNGLPVQNVLAPAVLRITTKTSVAQEGDLK